jgi:hypothetical protein
VKYPGKIGELRGLAHMVRVSVYFDRKGNTLTVWFDDPQREHICEEIGNEVVLMKDKSGCVIGFEKLNLTSANSPLDVGFEAVEA